MGFSRGRRLLDEGGRVLDEAGAGGQQGGVMIDGLPTPSGDFAETMRFDPVEGLLDTERHLASLAGWAAAGGAAFDRHHVRNELQAATFRVRSPSIVRLLLSRGGAVAIEITPIRDAA